MNKLWVISDQPECAYELIGKAREFPGHITAYLVGDRAAGDTAVSLGAHLVKLMRLPENTVWEQYFAVLCEEAETEKPELVLVNATKRGKTLAALLAAKLDCPCISEGQKIALVDGKLQVQRIVYGGLASKAMTCPSLPVVITVAPHTFDKPEAMAGHSGEVMELAPPAAGSITLVKRKGKDPSSVNLAEARVVVGVGRGFTEESQLKLAEQLAQVLGAEIGCTRPISEDFKWLPEERYIGISGQQIKPDLYLCAGVSGQVQHVYGVRDAKVVVSINNNENAPIFKVSDYYLVADLNEAIPAIIAALQS
ncbi:MAG TPA: electron transfer flavoprotein subunit alpha/FixB family protein [Clostridia bacterium]|nr:electron transfer flavoprotein subunit alpha/FixB family protein [Clostridia bacterium]